MNESRKAEGSTVRRSGNVRSTLAESAGLPDLSLASEATPGQKLSSSISQFLARANWLIWGMGSTNQKMP